MTKSKIIRVLHEEDRETLITRTKVATFYLAIPLVLSFALVDFFFRPDLMKDFFIARIFVLPVSMFSYLLYRSKNIETRLFYLPAHILTLYLGIYNSYMVMLSGGETSLYYAGLNLVAIGSLSFLPFTPRQLVVSMLTIYAPYFLLLPFYVESLNFSFFVPHCAFMFSTLFVGAVVNILTRKLRLAEIESRLQLHSELETKQEIIKRKTQEGIYLEKLASQFSPQVIDAIKAEEVSLATRERREVTCIFIDVENSTKRSSKLDFDNYMKLLSNFFSDCVEIFLKHDVTIGTYLGDGILAFTNAPKKSKSHRQSAVNACMEIINILNKKKNFYNEIWRSEFNIRIGINTGYAYIGFFPSITRGTYTAIGEAVNLASRLCTIGNVNEVCVTKDFVRELGADLKGVDLKKVGTVEDIKGLEGEKFVLYSVLPKIREISAGERMCPLCNKGTLLVEETFEDSELFRCSICSYYDIFDIDKGSSKVA